MKIGRLFCAVSEDLSQSLSELIRGKLVRTALLGIAQFAVIVDTALPTVGSDVADRNKFSHLSLMRVNLPLLYEQLRAGIRNEVDGLARRLKPTDVLMRPGNLRETRFNGLFEGDKNQ